MYAQICDCCGMVVKAPQQKYHGVSFTYPYDEHPHCGSVLDREVGLCFECSKKAFVMFMESERAEFDKPL